MQMGKVRRELSTRSEQEPKVICSTPSRFSLPRPWCTWDNICFCIYQQIWCLALSMELEYPPSWTHSKAYQPPWMPEPVSRKTGVERDQDTVTWGPSGTSQMATPPSEQVPRWGSPAQEHHLPVLLDSLWLPSDIWHKDGVPPSSHTWYPMVWRAAHCCAEQRCKTP